MNISALLFLLLLAVASAKNLLDLEAQGEERRVLFEMPGLNI